MALQDLTPKLRTRLNRLERVVALFVGVAVLLVLVGLGFYTYRVADRRGWFLRKLPYYTFVRNASGLKVGDPVKLLGFDVGTITVITAQPADDRYYDVFIGFEIKDPYYGYLWENSRAKIFAADLLGNRVIEVTKGTNGVPTYVFSELREFTLAEASELVMTNYQFGQEVWDKSMRQLLVSAYDPLTSEALVKLGRAGIIGRIQFIDKSDPTSKPDGIWDFQAARYVPLEREKKGYFLAPLESTAVGERLEALVGTVENALPNVMDLTNQLRRVMVSAADAVEHADALLRDAQPALRHLNQITAHLTNSQGTLGEWLFTTNVTGQIAPTLASAHLMLTNTDARLQTLATNLNDALQGLDRTLENLANITSNLHAQVDANTNLVSSVSRLLIDADTFVQGLKRHWLLRSAFREQRATPAADDPQFRRTQSPKALER